ncbi:hypothetical protein IMSAGC003_02640 [Lachnospiraceae bacterium]|nr:hypothetical protein IMSAGC003_02640 [Lachnospiraceae bacterium]
MSVGFYLKNQLQEPDTLYGLIEGLGRILRNTPADLRKPQKLRFSFHIFTICSLFGG